MALSGDSRTRSQVDPSAMRVAHAAPPYAYRCPLGSANDEDCAQRAAADVGHRIDAHAADGVAAVLMEPNAGTNGIVAPPAYWPALRAVTREKGVYLIADEVMSGFGRCGHWFAWQRYGDEGRPDMMTLAKGLTGAHLPLGAVVVSPEICRILEPQMLFTGLTYCGHPLSCAAGVAALESYAAENLVERSRVLGGQMFAALKALASRHAVIGDVRGGDGLFAVVELVRDRATREPLAPWPAAHPALTGLLRAALAEGVSFASRGNLLILAPPLVIGEQELADALALLDRLLGTMTID
jgi:taurine--2-oxoglutarate transaminase